MTTSADVDRLLCEAAANVSRAARAVHDRFAEFPDTDVTHARIVDIEHEGDRLTREIIGALRDRDPQTMARDDLYTLATTLDDVVDNIDHASGLLDLYSIEATMQQSIDQCEVLCAISDSLERAVSALVGGSDVDALLDEIDAREDDGDRIEREAVAALFADDGISPRTIIQWKDVFAALEDAVDSCARTAHTIGNISVRR
jgi:predicted phosphate transport protein (TIGR00153 family)